MGKVPSHSITMLVITLRSQGATPTEGNHKARFYDYYRKLAEEYDGEFLKRYGEDLDTTLIFVGSTSRLDETC